MNSSSSFFFERMKQTKQVIMSTINTNENNNRNTKLECMVASWNEPSEFALDLA